jgi:mevalonate kinase
VNSITVVGENEHRHPELKKVDVSMDRKAQFYYGRGKLLLSGEYVVLDGAQALAVPLQVGQSLSVNYSASFNPSLTWKSFDHEGNLWLEARFEFWRFNCLDPNPSPEILELQKILRAARKLNTHFLREENDVFVETRLGFPLSWGFGSSSTLLYNIAQWAYVSPFQLQFMTFGGSGYDVACAQSDGPILYTLDQSGPNWSPTMFEPPFADQLALLYLGQKQNSREAVARYQEQRHRLGEGVIEQISELTKRMMSTQSFEEFETIMEAHEEIMSHVLDIAPVKERLFKDYNGCVKSLGAWGGDFALVSLRGTIDEARAYFEEKDYSPLLPYTSLVYNSNFTSQNGGHDNLQ